MSNKSKIALIGFSILFLAALGIGGYYLYKNYFATPLKNISKLNAHFPGGLFGPTKPSRAEKLDADKIIFWTNKYRDDEGLPALTKNNLLVLAAQQKSDDLFDKQYFEHVSPSGVSPSDLVTSVGYNYKTTGENLALGDFLDEKDLVDAWMNSPGHRANILNKEFSEIGVYSDLDEYPQRGTTWISVQEFGHPAPNCQKPDEDLISDINTNKAELENLNSQINTLSAEASNLNAQANEQIKKGNDTYKKTNDTSKAQPYWDKGEELRNQAQDKINLATQLQQQAEDLSQEIQSESDQYNKQVDIYNECIKT